MYKKREENFFFLTIWTCHTLSLVFLCDMGKFLNPSMFDTAWGHIPAVNNILPYILVVEKGQTNSPYSFIPNDDIMVPSPQVGTNKYGQQAAIVFCCHIGKCSNAAAQAAAAPATATSFELSLNFDYHPFIIWSYRRHRHQHRVRGSRGLL